MSRTYWLVWWACYFPNGQLPFVTLRWDGVTAP